MERTGSVYTIKSKEFDLTTMKELTKNGNEFYINASDAGKTQIAASAVCVQLSLMMVKTKNRIMPLYHWDSADEEERKDALKEYYLCKMYWQEGDDVKIYEQFVAFFNQLAEIAATYSKDDDLNSANDFVKRSPAASALWEKYLRPIELKSFDAKAIREINEKRQNGLELTKAESEYREHYNLAAEDECRSRLSCSITAAQTVVYVKRLFMLMVLQAPQFVLMDEMVSLAIAMALNEYCTQIKKVETA